MNTLHHGDCLAILPTLESGSADAIITDPPYSSGSLHRGGRTSPAASKYVQSGAKRFGSDDFAGDNRDQRSWNYWCQLWLAECLRVVKPGGYCLVFTDWRQLPTLTDAVQAAGWIWRGLIAWDKGPTARAPHTNYFRHQCEYVVWGTKGELPVGEPGNGGPHPGCISCPVLQADKHHMTGKPTELMRRLARVAPAGGVILDPFMGSGSTGVGAVMEGRQFIGIECQEEYVEISRQRLAAVQQEVVA